jgi:transcriptional adapter 3
LYDHDSLPSRSLVPASPTIQLPAPTPSKQSEINEDFDNAKPSSQVPYTTFANWVNDFFRSFGEDDLAFLAPKPEDIGVYEIPPLGPHYPDTWAAMDAELAGEQPDPPPPSTALVPPPLRRFKSSNLSTNALPTENMYLGPLGERLISAFKNTKDIRGMMEDLFAEQEQATLDQNNADNNAMDAQGASGDGVQAREASFNNLHTSPQLAAPAMFNDPKLLAATPSIKEMDALDFESRLTRELSFLGLIPLPARAVPPVPTKPSKKNTIPDNSAASLDLSSSVDWSSRADDEISFALRACQRELRKQTALNDQRKERLSQIVRQRIAYQEFEHLRDGLEAVIEGAWAKRQRAAQRKAQKDRKEKDKKGEREKDRDKIEAASLAQSIAALNTPQPLSASLVAALTKRRNLVDSVQPLFPPNAYILPEESIYQGMEGAPTKLVEGNFSK